MSKVEIVSKEGKHLGTIDDDQLSVEITEEWKQLGKIKTEEEKNARPKRNRNSGRLQDADPEELEGSES